MMQYLSTAVLEKKLSKLLTRLVCVSVVKIQIKCLCITKYYLYFDFCMKKKFNDFVQKNL